MNTPTIIVKGISPEEVQRTIEERTKGWKLFFVEPMGQHNYTLINTFWGKDWDGTPEVLKQHIIDVCGVPNKPKYHPHIVQFMLNGKERFLFCSWTEELYDCATRIKYSIEPKFSINIVGKMQELGVL